MKKRLDDFDPTKITYDGKRLNTLTEDELFLIAYTCMAAQALKMKQAYNNY